jgi:hypothetical protein
VLRKGVRASTLSDLMACVTEWAVWLGYAASRTAEALALDGDQG